jgi:hypothetical protein
LADLVNAGGARDWITRDKRNAIALSGKNAGNAFANTTGSSRD